MIDNWSSRFIKCQTIEKKNTYLRSKTTFYRKKNYNKCNQTQERNLNRKSDDLLNHFDRFVLLELSLSVDCFDCCNNLDHGSRQMQRKTKLVSFTTKKKLFRLETLEIDRFFLFFKFSHDRCILENGKHALIKHL